MECKINVRLCQGDILVHSGSQEFRVVDLASPVDINTVKYLLNRLKINVSYVVVVHEALLYLVQCYNSRVSEVDCSECFSESCEVYVYCYIVDQELKSLQLQLLWCSEVFEFHYNALV